MAGKFAPRPDHLIIGHDTYTIEWLTIDEWHARNNEENWGGLTDHVRKVIEIRLMPNAPEAHFQEILTHEMLHGVWAATSLNFTAKDHFAHKPDDGEEAVIQTMGGPLMGVLRNNPAFLAWLNSDGQKVR